MLSLAERVKELNSWTRSGPAADADLAGLRALLGTPERAGDLGRIDGFRLIRLLGIGGLGAVLRRRTKRSRGESH